MPRGAGPDVRQYNACLTPKGKATDTSTARSCRPFLDAPAAARISLSRAHIGHQATPNATLRRGPLLA